MALITNLSTLRSALADTLGRTNSSAFQDTADIWIQLAEQDFQRDPRIREPGSNNSVLPSIHTTNPNWLITAEPDIYFYGALIHSAPYYKDDTRLQMWQVMLENAVSKLSGSVRLNPNRSLALTTYAELQTVVADALNRGDMKNVIPVLITMAERQLDRDPRVRNLDITTYSITADGIAVPTGWRLLEEWYHDGSTYYGPIEIVSPATLSEIKQKYGPTGVPRAAAIIDGTFYFGPTPDATYSTKMVFKRTVPALASGVNWLYSSHPDIYVHATIAEAGPWVVGDVNAEKVVLASQLELERRLESLRLFTWEEQFSGTLRKQVRPIG